MISGATVSKIGHYVSFLCKLWETYMRWDSQLTRASGSLHDTLRDCNLCGKWLFDPALSPHANCTMGTVPCA